MDALGWTSAEGHGAIERAQPGTGVRWRRRGAALELDFDKPIGDAMWKRNAFSPGAIPIMWGLGWGVLGVGAYAALAVVGGVISLFSGFAIPAGLAILGGVLVGPVSAIAGFFAGRRRAKYVRQRQYSEDQYTEAVSTALGSVYRGVGAKSFLQKISEVMRTGRPQKANVLSVSGYAEFRIEPVGESTIRIRPTEIPTEGKWYNKFANSLQLGSIDETKLTAPVDRKMAVLEERLDAIQKIGHIDSKHPSYPSFIILQVDRITEYRKLAVRANAVASMDTPDSQATALELVEDLERVVELMKVGVDELEQKILVDSEISSDAHLMFLREKYNRVKADPEGTGPGI
ncbi:MAG: hypothetical protein ACTHXA_01805 [Gulosibacter sp.]|uniref:hypothetical protein n=1 Tax=Gulosibacter sp. TaxID=2817531 RepID=UPI003F8E7A06